MRCRWDDMKKTISKSKDCLTAIEQAKQKQQIGHGLQFGITNLTDVHTEQIAGDATKVKYGGATRSKLNCAYHLIPAIAHEAEAVRWQLGAEKHGTFNWQNGNEEFVMQLFNHLEMHLRDIKQGGEQDGHASMEEPIFNNIGAIKWAASAILWYSINRPDIFDAAIIGMVDKQKE